MADESLSKKKRKRAEDSGEKEHKLHKKRKFVSEPDEHEEDQEEGPKIINMLAKKSSLKLKAKKKSPQSENDSKTEADSKKKKKRKKRKKKPKVENEKKNVDEDGVDNPDGENKPPKKIKKLKKSKAEKMGEQVMMNSSNVDKKNHETPAQNKALSYLKTWKESPSDWKFNKCTQIWLLQNAYNEQKISDKHFDILLEYLPTIKGRMKCIALERADKLLKLESKWKELEGTKTIDEIHKEIGELRPAEKKLDRAKEIKLMMEEN